MAKKKSKIVLEDKALKKEVVNKEIDWDSFGESVTIVGTGMASSFKKGREVVAFIESAKVLVNKGWARIK